MALPDVSFTNNLGTITFKRALLGVTDSWEWQGRGVRHVKTISVQAYVQQGQQAEKLNGCITDETVDGKRQGNTGSLILPWTTLSNMKLVGIEWPDSKWINFTAVNCTFVDDNPQSNRYTFTLLGYTLYNPRVHVPSPTRTLLDDYPQLRWFSGGTYIPNDARSGVFRMRGTERNMELAVGGTIRTPDAKLPDNLIQSLQMRAGFSTNPLRGNPLVPGGYPSPFNLGDAIPELKDDLNLAHCIVTGGRVVWNVERQSARIDLSLMAPPQKAERTA